MTLVDFITLSSDEEDDIVPTIAEAATSSPIPEPDGIAPTQLSMVDNGSTMWSLMADKSVQTENQEFLETSDGTKDAMQPGNDELIAAGDCVGEAMQSEREAGVFSPMTEQAAATFLILTEQGAITSSLREDKSIQSWNQMFAAAVGSAKEAIQSKNTAEAAGSPSMTERGATRKSHHVGQLCQTVGCPHIVGDGLDLCISHGGGQPHGEPGSSTVPCTKSEVSIKHKRHSEIRVKGAAENAMGSTGIYNLHALEELEVGAEKDENCDFEAETETLSPHDKEKETNRFGKFYDRKGRKQVYSSSTASNRQLNILHTKGVPPTLHNGDSGFSVMGNSMASIGISVLDGEVVMSTYHECSKTSQGSTNMYGKVCNSGSNGCMVQGCTNGKDGGTNLCIFHHSRLRKRCCEVIGCTTVACTGSQGRTDRCVKHGGGKRCKYDGCGKGAQGKTDFCIAHGGRGRCKFQGCKKSAQGRSDYRIEHGGSRCCKFPGCSVSTTRGKCLCSMHRTSSLSGNNSDSEMLPAPASAPTHQEKKAERSKRRNSRSVIGRRSQKRQNTSGCVNTVVETGEENGRGFVCQNNMLKEQQTSHWLNSDSGLAAGS